MGAKDPVIPSDFSHPTLIQILWLYLQNRFPIPLLLTTTATVPSPATPVSHLGYCICVLVCISTLGSFQSILTSASVMLLQGKSHRIPLPSKLSSDFHSEEKQGVHSGGGSQYERASGCLPDPRLLLLFPPPFPSLTPEQPGDASPSEPLHLLCLCHGPSFLTSAACFTSQALLKCSLSSQPSFGPYIYSGSAHGPSELRPLLFSFCPQHSSPDIWQSCLLVIYLLP